MIESADLADTGFIEWTYAAGVLSRMLNDGVPPYRIAAAETYLDRDHPDLDGATRARVLAKIKHTAAGWDTGNLPATGDGVHATGFGNDRHQNSPQIRSTFHAQLGTAAIMWASGDAQTCEHDPQLAARAEAFAFSWAELVTCTRRECWSPIIRSAPPYCTACGSSEGRWAYRNGQVYSTAIRTVWMRMGPLWFFARYCGGCSPLPTPTEG